MDRGYPVVLEGLLAGEDQVNNWMQTANGASQYWPFKALTATTVNGSDATTFGAVNGSSGLVIGTVGAASDYLGALNCSVSVAAQSRVTLQDMAAVSYTSAGSNTAFTTVTAVNFGTGTIALTAAQAAALIGQFLICTVTLTGVAGNVLVARKITGATATANSSPNYSTTLTVDTLTVNGIAANAMVTTVGQAFIAPLIEILPANTPIGNYNIPLNIKSKYTGWKLFNDSGVSVIASGEFS